MNANDDIKGLYQIAVLAACVAAAALLIGGGALAISGRAPTASAEQLLVSINVAQAFLDTPRIGERSRS